MVCENICLPVIMFIVCLCLLTRWKRDSSGSVMKRDNKPILEFVAIKRRDCGEWAIPGVSC